MKLLSRFRIAEQKGLQYYKNSQDCKTTFLSHMISISIHVGCKIRVCAKLDWSRTSGVTGRFEACGVFVDGFTKIYVTALQGICSFLRSLYFTFRFA